MAIEVHRDMVRNSVSAFDDGTPVTEFATPTAGDEIVIKRGSTFYRALVDLLLGGGGASLPIDVAAPAAGQEVYGVVDGVGKRIPIAQLINQAYPAPLGLWDHWTDWRAASGNANAPGLFAGAAISSGTNNTALPTGGMAGYNDHGVFLRSSTTANGGYRYQTTSLVGMYFGGVARKFRCQFLWRTSFTGRTVRTGFHDANTVADAVDGAYFEISGSTCSAKTANNSTRTTHATTITLALDTAYTFDIEVNAAGTEARFRVWGGNDHDTALMDVTITTNIPTTSARAFGAGIVATESSTTASDIGILYSIGMGTPAGFARQYGVYSTPVVGPSAFTAEQWTAAAVAGGIELDVTAIPASGTSGVTAINYRLNGGAAVALTGTGTGVRTVSGLTPGDAYSVQLQLVTAVSGSQWSDTKTRTPVAATAPAAFTAGQWTATAGASSIVVDITALPSNGGSAITELQYRLDGGTPVAFAGTGTGSRTITGLTPSTEYDVEIRAVNAVGNGAWSDLKSATPTAGGSLTVVQAPTPVEQAWGTQVEQALSAVGSGNSLVVVVHAPSGAGAPTISDSAGGSWGAADRTYTDGGGNSTYYFLRNGVTGGPTWVRATFGGNTGSHITAYEVSGAGAGLVEDDWDFGAQTSTDTWNMPFTSTAANVLLVAMLSVDNGSTPTGTSPLTAATATGGYQIWARGIFPTAGSNTATVTLSAGYAGSRSWLALKGS